ncbi:MAG TPA: c-type cytochrome domain-containing protein, partial [Bryobacteraceae bacterium]|nr:c-type cytochrome domain-containing protein [Bryobacteraceae bacterium]
MSACKALALFTFLHVAAFGQIQAVFEKNCLPCHGPQTKSGGLDLSTKDGLLKGGEHGPAIVSGDPKASLLYKLVSHEAEPHMPYKGDRLPQETIDRIGEWIKAGAPFESAADLALFRKKIKPILEANCVRCHNSQIRRSGFDLSTREALLRGG